MIDITTSLDLFSRSGGGGSSSSGGGGGGSEIIIALGYLIGYYCTKIIKKFARDDIAKFLSATIMLLISLFFVLFIVVIGSFITGYIVILIVVGLWTGWYAQINNLWSKLKSRIKKADADIAVAAKKDSAWDEEKLHKLAIESFLRFQDDWTRLDPSTINQYAVPRYAEKAGLLMQILRDLNRQNAVINPQVIKIDTINIYDNEDNSQDFFTVMIEARADDQLIDMRTNEVIFSDRNSFIEYWSFQRTENSWKISNIEQATADQLRADATLRQLADEQNMFYSLDMGWLFLPARGEVFHDGRFGKSDINNHLVGVVNGILTQIYTYNSKFNNDSKIFVIGQITVPKFYGHILVKPKQKFFSFDNGYNLKEPKGSEKYDFEWQDFNKKYEVYATDYDRLASFELINPKFMEMMYAIDENLVLEVTDNIIFFRVTQQTSLATYSQLLNLLKQAHKELKL
jgi:hypothetical protein